MICYARTAVSFSNSRDSWVVMSAATPPPIPALDSTMGALLISSQWYYFETTSTLKMLYSFYILLVCPFILLVAIGHREDNFRLLGVTMVQLYFYAGRYPHDRRWTKLLARSFLMTPFRFLNYCAFTGLGDLWRGCHTDVFSMPRNLPLFSVNDRDIIFNNGRIDSHIK